MGADQGSPEKPEANQELQPELTRAMEFCNALDRLGYAGPSVHYLPDDSIIYRVYDESEESEGETSPASMSVITVSPRYGPTPLPNGEVHALRLMTTYSYQVPESNSIEDIKIMVHEEPLIERIASLELPFQPERVQPLSGYTGGSEQIQVDAPAWEPYDSSAHVELMEQLAKVQVFKRPQVFRTYVQDVLRLSSSSEQPEQRGISDKNNFQVGPLEIIAFEDNRLMSLDQRNYFLSITEEVDRISETARVVRLQQLSLGRGLKRRELLATEKLQFQHLQEGHWVEQAGMLGDNEQEKRGYTLAHEHNLWYILRRLRENAE